MCKKGYFWNPAACSCEYDVYVGSIISDYVVIFAEIIDMTKAVPTKSILTKCTSTFL